jgi:hypothetical protein
MALVKNYVVDATELPTSASATRPVFSYYTMQHNLPDPYTEFELHL